MIETIIHIAPCYVDFANGTGGVANVIRALAQTQSSNGYKVRVIDTDEVLGKKKGTVGSRKESCGVEHVTYRHPKLASLFFNNDYLEDALESEPKAVYHVHTCFSPFVDIASRILQRTERNFFFSAHGKLSPGMVDTKKFLKTAWWRYICYESLKRSKAIPTSENEKRYFSKAGLNQQTEVVPNGVERLEDSFLKNLPRVEKRPYIIYLGYLDPRKQPDFLVKAFAASGFSKRGKLVFAGPDEYGFKKQISNAARATGVLESIKFLGGVYNEDKWAWLSHAHCLCLPSKGEGQPLVVLEALQSGVPVIASELSNVDLSDAGIVLRDFDVENWASAIDEICDQTSNGVYRQRARSLGANHCWDVINEKMIIEYCKA